MTATKHGLDLPARDDTTPGGGLVDDVKADLIALDHASIYESETTPDPSIIHDGFLWYDLAASQYKYYHGPSLSWLVLDVGGAGGLAAHIASVPATHAADSITATHIAAGAVGSSELAAGSVTAGKIAAGGVSAANQLAAGVADDTVIGNRTIDPTLAGGANTGAPTSLWSWLAKFIKQIKGTTNWWDAPATDLAGAAAHAAASAPHGGHSTPASVAAAISVHNALAGAHDIYFGSGSPESAVVAGIGSLYRDITNGLTWEKRTGTGNTGWKRVGMAIKSLQRGTITITGTTATATITTVDPAKSELRHTGSSSSGGADHPGMLGYLTLTNATTITATRGGGTGTLVIGFELTEWE